MPRPFNHPPRGGRRGHGAPHGAGPGGRRGCHGPPLSCGQNFLTGAGTINALLRRTSLCRADHVVEIGPGKGHITGALLRRCGRVSAVELDAALHQKLAARFAGEEGLRLYRADFLNWPLPTGPYKVFANIPFCHTTAIVRRLVLAANPPAEMWLVMEKGAAGRFMGIGAENAASLALKPLYSMRVAWRFCREDFHPAPSVDAVLLHFEQKKPPDLPAAQRALFARFVRQGLRCGMKGLCTQRQVSRALGEAGLPRDFTPANALYVQWLCLFRCSLRLNSGLARQLGGSS